jgi:hypothetical protein
MSLTMGLLKSRYFLCASLVMLYFLGSTYAAEYTIQSLGLSG